MLVEANNDAIQSRSRYDAYLEARLQQWALWYLKIQNGEIGWPVKSIIKVIMEYGCSIKTGRVHDMPDNELAEEVNLWVKRLGKAYPALEQALRTYYFERNLPVKRMATKHDCSVTVFKDRVSKAKMWLSGRLSSDYE